MREISKREFFMRSLKIISLVYLLVLLLSGPVAAQKDKDDVFAEVPVSMRTNFIKRLNMLVEAMQIQKYECVYMLLSKQYTKDENREAFITRLNQFYSAGDKIIDFVPTAVGSDAESGKEPNYFIVTGCLEIHEKNRKIKVSGSVNVFVEDGSLYFSELGANRTLDGKYLPCK